MIEASGLNHFYRVGGHNLQVLHGLSLRVAKGEMVAIQGPSGSGKSTLMYLFGCLQKASSGRLLVDNIDVATLDEAALARFRSAKLGFVFQQFHLMPRATVLENILLPAHFRSDTSEASSQQRDRAVALANTLGLAERLDHLPNQLSGGQQQRVAIARALLNDPPLILADEPTGNLDSQTSTQILGLLRDLNKQGRTVVIITHDPDVAARCDRVIHVRDGVVVSGAEPTVPSPRVALPTPPPLPPPPLSPLQWLSLIRRQLPQAWQSLNRNRARTFLTMMGISIGIAAVLSMVTLGQFTKWKILDTYADLGVDTLSFYGYQNWDLKATDRTGTPFYSFDWERDIQPLRRIFPEIRRMSPVMHSWNSKVVYAGKVLNSDDVMVRGVNEEQLAATKRELLLGRNMNSFQVKNASPVCLIGFEIFKRLFGNVNPEGQVLTFGQDGEKKSTCRVIGVLKHATSKEDWLKPDYQLIIPFTYFQNGAGGSWQRGINTVTIQLLPGVDVERVGKAIRVFFEQKYGKAGTFRVDTDSVLVSQMKKFLTLFSILLTLIAMVSLAVGGMGIANMMLVSVSERYREIGLLKALGATPVKVRLQFLMEAVVICCLGGVIGILLGMVGYHLAIYGATKLIPKLEFAWMIDWFAMSLSVSSILVVGILSGLFPAIKAERLQVIEAMRSD